MGASKSRRLVKLYTNVKLQNGIFDHFNVTKDVDAPYSTTIPTAWDLLTIMDCDFKNNIDAGNIDYALTLIDTIKIKRRIKGEFDWLTLASIPIRVASDLKFIKPDFFNQNNIEYEYALVPVMSGVEGEYIIQSVLSQFDGVFICDYETIFKFYAGVSYGDTESIQAVGVYEPIGAKYPIVVVNANTDYHTGSVNATMMPSEFYTDGTIDRQAIVNYTNLVDKFLKNKRAKILKDWNGSIYLLMVTGNPSLSYANNYGMGIINTSFSWTEQGDPNNQESLYDNGLVNILE